MLTNQYELPSELPDSLIDSSHQENPSIKAVNLYQLDDSVSESEERDPLESGQLQIVHSLDESSMEQDDFLEMVKREENRIPGSVFQTKSTLRSQNEVLLVDRTQISLTLMQSQKTKQTVTFTNPTANPIKMRFSDCSFQIQSDKMLDFVMAEHLEVIIEPWDKVELTFSIEHQYQHYGDVIQTIVVMGEFIGREDQITPVKIDFHVRYVSPIITLKYLGNTEVVTLMQGKLAIVSLKPNKLGEYQLDIELEDSLPKMELQVQARGKITVSTDMMTLYAGQSSKLKLRQRGLRNLKGKQKYGLLLKPLNSEICYVMGLNFIL